MAERKERRRGTEGVCALGVARLAICSAWQPAVVTLSSKGSGAWLGVVEMRRRREEAAKIFSAHSSHGRRLHNKVGSVGSSLADRPIFSCFSL